MIDQTKRKNREQRTKTINCLSRKKNNVPVPD